MRFVETENQPIQSVCIHSQFFNRSSILLL